MEIGIDNIIPTYSGGLGVLAGDTIKSCADLEIPMIALTLLYRKGHFNQRLGRDGQQFENDEKWRPEDHMEPLSFRTSVEIEGRKVVIRPWLYNYVGGSGFGVPILFLDADMQENSSWDRSLNEHLYGGDQRYRFAQEILLGIGGGRILEEMDCRPRKYHMNEGHASLLTLELLSRTANHGEFDREGVKKSCVFTTHTPVSAGHDIFDHELVSRMLGNEYSDAILKELGGFVKFNMTKLALNLSAYVNGVAKKHGEISRKMFPGYEIESITNGVHTSTWLSESMGELFENYIPGVKNDPFSLRRALAIPSEKIMEAHSKAKRELLRFVNEEREGSLQEDNFTVGFARRATEYKRPTLIFSDLKRLRTMDRRIFPIQFVFAGKAHPRDLPGKGLIRSIYSIREELGKDIPVEYIENYDMDIAKLLVSGVDLWLNTPQRPLEASGTSGMKAALNGVPSLSIPDGWWIEGCIEGLTGWSIGSTDRIGISDRIDAEDLYDKLEGSVLPLYKTDQEAWADIMKHTIAINGSYFNTHRMVREYVQNAYLD